MMQMKRRMGKMDGNHENVVRETWVGGWRGGGVVPTMVAPAPQLGTPTSAIVHYHNYWEALPVATNNELEAAYTITTTIVDEVHRIKAARIRLVSSHHEVVDTTHTANPSNQHLIQPDAPDKLHFPSA
jgi:hypothetical protein